MKKITRSIIMLAFLLFVSNSFAQFSHTWLAQYQHSTTHGFSNEGRRIAEDAAGNIFVMSDVTSDIDPFGVQGTSTWNYLVITKYNSNGTVVSSTEVNVQKHIYSGFNVLGAFGLELDASGNVYAGYTTWNSATVYDVALTKFTNSLVRVWTSTYGTNGDDIGIDMKLNSGNLYAVVKTVGINTNYSIIKSVPSNNPATLFFNFPPSSAYINSITVDANYVYVGGYSIKAGYKNAYVAAIHLNNGINAWASIYTPPGILGDDAINKVTVGVDGNLYSIGYSYQGPAKGKQVLALKNLNGDPRFNYVVLQGENGIDDNGTFIDAAQNGWVVLGSESGLSAIVYRFPSSGIFGAPAKVTFLPVPTSAYNTINGITLNAMKVSNSSNIYITGGVTATSGGNTFTSSFFYKATVAFGNALSRANGFLVEGQVGQNREGLDLSIDYAKADVYMLRNNWDANHDIEIVELVDVNVPSPVRNAEQVFDLTNDLSISPNPAKDIVTIKASSNMNNIEVMNLTGNRIMTIPVNSNEASFDVSLLAKGIYICKIQSEDGVAIRKIVKE